MTPLAQIEDNPTTETIVYLHTDHLMTNRLATDQFQTVVWRWEGEAFGNTPAQELAGISVNLRFPGQYFDVETNLHYNHFRYYDPELGRYITSDPIGLDGGMNTYGYVGGSPLRYIDPKGLDIWLGGEIKGGGHILLAGMFFGVSNITNVSTGENCTVRVACLRIGFGIFIGGGTGVMGNFAAAHCGKDIGGVTVGVAFDVVIPGAPGAGGSVDFGGGLGIGGGAGVDGGAGASAGIEICSLKVIGCVNTPTDCVDCELNDKS